MLWNSNESSVTTVYYMKMQVFDILYNAVSDVIKVDSNTTGYLYEAYISKIPDNDNEIGLAWATYDTLYAAFFNAGTKKLSSKQVILKGTGVSNIQAVDFLHNGNIRTIWRDVNNNLRHKKISKTGEVLNNESILIGQGETTYYPGTTNYSSNKNGDFMLAELHQNPVTYNYGIDVRKYNADATLINGPVWICVSVTVDAWEDRRETFQIAVQDDGKAAVVWRDMVYDHALSTYIKFLFMQFLDNSGNMYGQTFRPVKVNNESYSKSYAVYEEFPFMRLKNDTVILIWSNYNTEFSGNSYLYMNIQKYSLPDVSSIKDHISDGLAHWCQRDDVSGECFMMIKSPNSTNVRLELYDALGRPVTITRDYYLQSGMNRISLNQWPGIINKKGLYIYRMVMNGRMYSSKINL